MTAFLPILGGLGPFWANAIWRPVWQGGVLIVLVWLLGLALPKVSGRVRCWWWRLVFLKILVGLVWVSPIQFALWPAASPTALAHGKEPARKLSPRPLAPASPAVAEIRDLPGRTRQRILDILLVLWAMGVAAGLLGLARQWCLTRRLISRSRKFRHAQIESDVAALSDHFGIRVPPEVRLADDLGVPLLSGGWHPVILMPASFLKEKSAPQLRMMMAHELAHVKRRDLFWAWLGLAVRVLFFFHPLVTLAKSENRLAEEMAADELAVTACRLKPVDYAQMLVEVAANLSSPRKEIWVVGIFGSHQTLKRRLQAMKHTHLSNRKMIAAAILVAVIGPGLIVPWQVTAQEFVSGPQEFNLAFGIWRPAESLQTDPAAAGQPGDYWNAVGVPWNNDHTEAELKFASREASPIQVRMINLGGGWSNHGRMGVKSPMLDNYNYPVNNQGGNAQVILKTVPAARYDIFIYGHEADPVAYGDYTLTVGDHKYERKTTTNQGDAAASTRWAEGIQFVKYGNVQINPGDSVEVLIQPGGQVTDGGARTFSDAMISGLQLVPVQ